MTLGDYLTAQQLSRSERVSGMGAMGNTLGNLGFAIADVITTIKSNPVYLVGALAGLYLARKPIMKQVKKITG